MIRPNSRQKLTTRTEHSRSIEDANKYRALEVLKQVGLLVPISGLEIYHGRVGELDESESWDVEPRFANGGNDSGNENINNHPSLYTSSYEVAKEFAETRLLQTIHAIFDRIFYNRVVDYTADERQEWLERINVEYQAWYDGIAPENKKSYASLLNEDGTLKLKTPDCLAAKTWREARRLIAIAPVEERQDLWERASWGLQANVHRIISTDTDATVLNTNFDASMLDQATREKYYKALEVLAIPFTQGSPVDFYDREQVRPFINKIRETKSWGFLSAQEIKDLAVLANVGGKLALQVASSHHARDLVQKIPIHLVELLLENKADIVDTVLNTEDGTATVPINLEYIKRFLREAHIVGVTKDVKSATINKVVSTVSLFDLENITTEEAATERRLNTWNRLGGIATTLTNPNQGTGEQKQPLLIMLANPYAKPEELVAAAKDIGGYADIFEADAGNWEGYTLEEHTETVLRNFDESFADGLPVELLAPMRLAILCHDLGKPRAAARGEKHKQMVYNLEYAEIFLDKLGVNNKLKVLLLSIIGDGVELAFHIDILKRGATANSAMHMLATKTMRQFNDTENVTDEQIIGFIEMCKMLQICDGGAYTSIAVTRPRVKGSGWHRNAPSFNDSFAPPIGLDNRQLRLRSAVDRSVAADLTPIYNKT